MYLDHLLEAVMRETANGGAISVALHRSKCLFKSSRQWFLTISSGFPVLAWMILGEIVFYTWPINMSYSCLAYDCFIHFFQRLTRSSNKVISMAKNNWSIWNRWKIRQTFWRERRKTKRFEKERYTSSLNENVFGSNGNWTTNYHQVRLE